MWTENDIANLGGNVIWVLPKWEQLKKATESVHNGGSIGSSSLPMLLMAIEMSFRRCTNIQLTHTNNKTALKWNYKKNFNNKNFEKKFVGFKLDFGLKV